MGAREKGMFLGLFIFFFLFNGIVGEPSFVFACECMGGRGRLRGKVAGAELLRVRSCIRASTTILSLM